ncbi:MAG: hypothetical protein HUJ87_15065 [Fusobacterium varium]|uniref:hypothetical protein n=1 Tax=Fusobacterium varium TaxID=856 RepID=UPI002432B084|nr:hypothetical protein [Fusobacterium varium]MCF0171813.1 hypothetical protein [Fusobacterium varium]
MKINYSDLINASQSGETKTYSLEEFTKLSKKSTNENKNDTINFFPEASGEQITEYDISTANIPSDESYSIPVLEVGKEILKRAANTISAYGTANEMVAAGQRRYELEYSGTEEEKKAADLEVKQFMKEMEDYRIAAVENKRKVRALIAPQENPLKRFGTSMAAEMLMSVTTPFGLGLQALTHGLIPVIIPKEIAVLPFPVQVGMKASVSAAANIFEEAGEIFINEGRTPEREELEAAGKGGFLASFGFQLLGAGLRRGFATPDIDIDSAAKNIQKNGLENLKNFKGDESALSINAAETVKGNLKVINSVTGKPDTWRKIINNTAEINGKSMPQVREAANLIVERIIKEPDMPLIKNLEDFHKVIAEDPKIIKAYLVELGKRSDFTIPEKQAIDFFLDLEDKNSLVDVSVDMEKMTDEVLEVLENPKNTYDPQFEVRGEKIPTNEFEDIYGFVEENVEAAKRQAELNDVIITKFGLDKKIETPEQVTETLYKLSKGVGDVIKGKYGFNNPKEAAKFYKQKYGLEFDFVKSGAIPGSLGTTEVTTDWLGKPKLKITLSEDLKDLSLALGALRHEIQHAIDIKNNPEFESKPFTPPVITPDTTLDDFFNASSGGHFKGFENTIWEKEYIVANEINSLISGNGEVNQEVAKILKLEIPDNLEFEDKKYLKDLIDELRYEPDLAKRLSNIKKGVQNYFGVLKAFREGLKSGLDTSSREKELKRSAQQLIIFPFRRKKEQMVNSYLSSFDVVHNGDNLDLQKVVDLFEENDGSIVDFIYFNKPLPKNLEKTPLVDSLKKGQLNFRVATNNSIGSKTTLKNAIMSNIYSQSAILKKLADSEDIIKATKNGELNVDDLILSPKKNDPLTGELVPEKLLNYSEKFAENEYERFPNAVETLKILGKSKNEIDPKDIINAIREARLCMLPEDLEKAIKKYEFDKNQEVKEFIFKNPDMFFPDPENLKANLENNLIASQKKNAKKFFIGDMESRKGTEKNNLKGTADHAMGRFNYFIEKGIITEEAAMNLALENRVSDRLFLNRMIERGSNAFAARETLPGGGAKGIRQVIDSATKGMVDRSKKSITIPVERYIEGEIGEELGIVTFADSSKFERIVNSYFNFIGRAAVVGPKAFKEFIYEPSVMGIVNKNRYGGSGALGVAKEVIKILAKSVYAGEELKKLDMEVGSDASQHLAFNFFNLLKDTARDYTGYRDNQLRKYGTTAEKINGNIDKLYNKFNWYGFTQKNLQRAAYVLGGANLKRYTKYATLEDLTNKEAPEVGLIFKRAGFNEIDFSLMKKISDTTSMKERGVYSELQFANILTEKDIEEAFGYSLKVRDMVTYVNDLAKRINNVYEIITEDISPTKITPGKRNAIRQLDTPEVRIFSRTVNFLKASPQVALERIYGGLTLSYGAKANGIGKDFNNRVRAKRLIGSISSAAALAIVGAAITNVDMYHDPLDAIDEMVDDFLDNPVYQSLLFLADVTNLWSLTSGSLALRPYKAAKHLAKGDYEKAGEELLKMTIGTQQVKGLKWLKENVLD